MQNCPGLLEKAVEAVKIVQAGYPMEEPSRCAKQQASRYLATVCCDPVRDVTCTPCIYSRP